MESDITRSVKVDFDSLDWHDVAPGARAKVHRDGTKQIRLVEFTDAFVAHDWCERGHIRLGLSGALEIMFRDHVVSYAEGSGVFIWAGPGGAHKARALTPVARLVLVEDG